MELEAGVHQLTYGRASRSGIPAPNAFLVCGSRGSVLLDSGWDEEADHRERLEYIRRVSARPLTEVVLMHGHPDHVGGALRLHRETGVPLSCHILDRELIERERFNGTVSVGIELHGGETRDLVDLTLQVIHAPGHTPGCLAAYVPETGALFTSDTVLSGSTTAVGDRGDLALYMQSLTMLAGLGAKTIYPGHGSHITDPDRRLAELIEHRQRREAELLRELERGERTATAICDVLYKDLAHPRRRMMAEAQVRSGLRKLIGEGKVRATEDGYERAS